MSLLDSIFRRKKTQSVPSSKEWENYCGFSLAERFDQLSHDQVVFLKQIRFSKCSGETLGALILLAAGETMSPGMSFETSVLLILDALNAKAPHEPGNLRREFRKLMDEFTSRQSEGLD